ncbi:MAG: anti-sigma factor family protein [Advenella sp.]|uniref:Anti-sigma factor n=1 Tax=Advenella kashmirensis TaxID=310575 RepID=A0A356LIE7_9BURK|nr:anti-sigma factor [Advenella sp. FME57]HBP30780.1 anti-sigma factor [Advenella kashmirensis]
MNDDLHIDDMMRHAYVDGRLNAEQQKAMSQYLAAHPQEARELDSWRKDAAQLQAAWQIAEPPLNPALDPAAIRRRLKERTNTRWQLAASVFVALCIGGLSGWQLRSVPASQLNLAARPLPMQDAIEAYRVFADNPALRADALATETDLQQWVAAHFSNAQRLPDLTAKGFHPVFARMLVTEEGPAAVVIYKNDTGQQTGFYIRPPGPGNKLLAEGQRQEGPLLTRYWSDRGYNYALVGSSSIVMNGTG